MRERPGSEVTIDLPGQTLIAPDRAGYPFDISPLRKERLIQGLDDIEVTLQLRDTIEGFEARRQAMFSWLPAARRE